ncbi:MULTISPECIES: ABC transporter permease [unclassified Micromonospora]|uniref:ABC transporter permease n=1 Tax=unclassified Micromonospora TaxID=2617518 RepID=UPI0010335D1C|nr:MULTISPECIES: ABC transporter permease [unclassified Micromonospora]QKW15205.1 ABC transporter permease [Verrucosispora sp. NA02020]TBL41771.1 ABC transporter permease [Verrucosispora sp. SN26_14.1]
MADATSTTALRTRSRRRPPALLFWSCLGVIGLAVLAGTLGPLLVPFDVTETNLADRLQPPGAVLSDGSRAWFGTDDVGRGMLSQILIGAQVSLLVGVATLLISGLFGTAVGIVAGFVGGWVDGLLMRLADIQLAFPSILLAILIAALLGPSLVNVIAVLAVTIWVIFARVARAQTMAVRNREYVDASRVLGARPLFLIWRCILPACAAPLLVVATVELGMVIITEAALSFLGLGTPTATPSWGLTIANGRGYVADAWWISTLPGIALSLLVVACGVVGDELRDRLDPHLKHR